MLRLKLTGILVLALAAGEAAWGQSPRQRAAEAYETAQREEIELKSRESSERSRSDYLKVIRLYERVYLITPHTGYADDALINIAALYQEIGDPRDAIKTLQFLIREYPSSRFVRNARADISRLRSPVPPPDPSPPREESATADTRTASRTPGSPVSVDNIRYWESPRSVRVVVDLDGEPVYVQGDVPNPPRVFVDIRNARVGDSLGKRALPVESMMLENIRVAQHDRETVRVVLDLVQLHNVTTFTLREPNRLVIDVLGDAPVRTTRAPESPAEPEGAPAPESQPAVSEAVDADPGPPVGTPAQPTGRGDHSLIRSLGLKLARVVIDPGHGGHDTGTIGPSGLTEKEIVLDVAHRLKRQIEEKMGAQVVLTRETDEFVPLETRTAIANKSEADLFISIHANSSSSRSIRGFETYFLNFTTSGEGLEIAARENAASQRSISELQDIVRKIMMRDKLDESREFATHVQKSLAAHKDLGRDRGVKQAPFVVLIGANMPSILAEVSFISNPDDERLLKGEERRQQIAEALFDGVRSYAETLSGIRTVRAQQY